MFGDEVVDSGEIVGSHSHARSPHRLVTKSRSLLNEQWVHRVPRYTARVDSRMTTDSITPLPIVAPHSDVLRLKQIGHTDAPRREPEHAIRGIARVSPKTRWV